MDKITLRREIYPLALIIIGSLLIMSQDINDGLFTGVIGLIVYGGFYLNTVIDPFKENYKRFSKTYKLLRDVAITAIFAFKFTSHLSNFGINRAKLLYILASLLTIIFGNYMPALKRNWFISGIKTPWTLSNEDVWNKTHRLGGKLFVLAGILGLISILITGQGYIFLVLLLLATVAITIYSFWVYQQYKTEEKGVKGIMSSNKKIIIFLLAILLVGSGVTYFVVKSKNRPIPASILDVQDFMNQQMGNYKELEDNSIEFTGLPLKNTENIYATSITSGQQPVYLMAVQYTNGEQAHNSYDTYKHSKKAHVVQGKLEVNIPSYISYFTAKAKGEKVIMWQKDNWIIVIQGQDGEQVKEIERQLQEYLK